MNKNIEKHLEFIQAVILRMGTNSFLIKNWAIVVVTVGASLILGLKEIKVSCLLLLGILIIPFWIMDAYYLSLERRYRDLYDEISKQDATNYSMNLKSEINPYSGLRCSFFSKTTLPFYLFLLLIILIIWYLGKFYA